jgi:HAD superfamily phosphatase (TIGR01668 family)
MSRRSLGRWLNPHHLYRSISEIDLDALCACGIRGILMDLDDTLCPRDSGETPPAVRTWLQAAATRFQLFIISNNMSLVRVQEVAGDLCIPAIHRAQKPRRAGIRHAMAQLGLQRHELVLIGDRLLTDVLASRRAGIMAILVEPFEPERRWLPRSVRRLEATLLGLVGDRPAWEPPGPTL